MKTQMSDAGGDALVEISMTSGGATKPGGCKGHHQGRWWNSCRHALRDDSAAARSYHCVPRWRQQQGLGEYPRESPLPKETTTTHATAHDGGCDVEGTITKAGVGNEDDRVIGTVIAYADANA